MLPCRDFVHSSYQELKKANPTFPILIRECSGVQARMIARYGDTLFCVSSQMDQIVSDLLRV